ncbi:MAG: phospholipid carrier-dependent glycosyltransferase [Planctomycetes bacterium]|nr:phospholipid carrier-dependent glycosyltransferase [Planctomycetota bacterium]MCB9903891.1 phospholipid carrier-dependent glycosyltransferase [Planctomycetota bacterium]
MEPTEKSSPTGSALGPYRRWALLLAAVCLLYFFQLGGMYNVNIGDESNYLQLARVTALQPGWLPLSTDEGPWSTKPPLLFWQGIVSVKLLGESLFGYRLVSVLYSLATAGLVARFVFREQRDRTTAIFGALVFLACFSTFRYGRAYLTNPPEVFWTFLAFSIVARFDRSTRGREFLTWTALGVILGVITLYRSFALVVPYCLFLAAWSFHERDCAVCAFLKRDVPRIVYVALLGLAIFSLWFALDPNPAEVWNTFVRGENAGKVDEHGYLRGLFSGPHSLIGLWTGPLANTALLALPLLALVRLSWKERRRLTLAERLGWTFVLAYLVAFSVPSQRSASYAMSGVPVLAALLALRWNELSGAWLRAAAIPLLVVFTLGAVLALRVQTSGVLGFGFPLLLWPTLVGGAWFAWRALRSAESARVAIVPLCFAVYLALTLALRPLEGPLGRYDDAAIAATRGADLLMPSNHLRKHERYRFLLEPGSVRGYQVHGLDLPPDAVAAIDEQLANGGIVGVVLPEGADPARSYSNCMTLGSRLDIRTRHNGEQLRAMILRGEMDLLLVREWLIRRADAAVNESAAPAERASR